MRLDRDECKERAKGEEDANTLKTQVSGESGREGSAERGTGVGRLALFCKNGPVGHDPTIQGSVSARKLQIRGYLL